MHSFTYKYCSRSDGTCQSREADGRWLVSLLVHELEEGQYAEVSVKRENLAVWHFPSGGWVRAEADDLIANERFWHPERQGQLLEDILAQGTV